MLQTKIVNKKLQEKHPNLAKFAEGFIDGAIVLGILTSVIGYTKLGKNVIQKK